MQTSVLAYLEEAAVRYPDKTAFSSPDAAITFGELALRAKAVGSGLGVRIPPRTPVVVYLDKSVDAIVAFLGAAYAGCFYSFLERSMPVARLNTILQTLQPGVIITNAANQSGAKKLNGNCDVFDIAELVQTPVDNETLKRVRQGATDMDPLYCNFTSGSTGTPKGVLVGHRSVIDFIDQFTELFGITKDDVMGNQAPLDFDVSVKDIYSGLKTGAEVVLIPKSYFTFQARLLDLLTEKQVTTLVWAVSALCLISTMDGLSYKKPTHIKRALFSGEVMPPQHLHYWQRHYPDGMFVNLYGPTEITCNCTYHIIDREYGPMESMPIGVAFPNERVFLLNEDGCMVTAPNAEGEICVAGTALSLGYYRDPVRTREAFMQNPANDTHLERIYRTGDIGYYGKDGLLYFVGRRDLQIKHHGRRIELGEIEAAISSADGVRRACAIYMDKEERIVCFYVGQAKPEAIRTMIKGLLPDYMIPEEFVCKDTFPLTNNGKLDRSALTAQWRSAPEN